MKRVKRVKNRDRSIIESILSKARADHRVAVHMLEWSLNEVSWLSDEIGRVYAGSRESMNGMAEALLYSPEDPPH